MVKEDGVGAEVGAVLVHPAKRPVQPPGLSGERKFDEKREDRPRGSGRGGGFRGGRDKENGRGGPKGGHNGYRE